MSTSLSYSLGADDISKIVDAILPPLSPLIKLSSDKVYPYLHILVVQNAQGKTYSNALELDTLVKTIVNNISSLILSENDPNKIVDATPDDVCTGLNTTQCFANYDAPNSCAIVNGNQCAQGDAF